MPEEQAALLVGPAGSAAVNEEADVIRIGIQDCAIQRTYTRSGLNNWHLSVSEIGPAGPQPAVLPEVLAMSTRGSKVRCPLPG